MGKKLLVCLLTIVLVSGVLPVSVLAALPQGVPSKLEAPVVGEIVKKTSEDGQPYFRTEVTIPKSVLELDKSKPAGGDVIYEYSIKIDNGAWSDFGGGGYLDFVTDSELTPVPGKANTFYIDFEPIDEGTMQETIIKDHTYAYKMRFYFTHFEGMADDGEVYSAVSNIASSGSGSFYSKAADWAKPELQKASDLELIPAILQGADMTKPITREEFCELSVLLYEKVTDESSTPVSPNPFKDTKNAQILKAFKLGITTGTSTTAFSPKVLINREQCAAMLFRTIKAIEPAGNYSITGVKDFPDQKYISGWAVESTKYISKAGIITGDAKGNFMPKATTTAQEATGYGMATREQSIALAVRTYNKLK